VKLHHGEYNAPVAGGDPFDLIVFSYCLTMIQPGYAEVLRLAQLDLSPRGHIAIVDFHDSSFGWFRRWMGVNHVRMEGQVLQALQESGFKLHSCQVRSAYGGVWRWITLVGRLPNLRRLLTRLFVARARRDWQSRAGLATHM